MTTTLCISAQPARTSGAFKPKAARPFLLMEKSVAGPAANREQADSCSSFEFPTTPTLRILEIACNLTQAEITEALKGRSSQRPRSYNRTPQPEYSSGLLDAVAGALLAVALIAGIIVSL